jgi:hypothetical protein
LRIRMPKHLALGHASSGSEARVLA